jgi:hypothetical protein
MQRMSKAGARVGLGLVAFILLLPLVGCREATPVTTALPVTTPPFLTTFFPPTTTQQEITFLPPAATTATTTLPTLPTIPPPTAIPTIQSATTTLTIAPTTSTVATSVPPSISTTPTTTAAPPPSPTLFPPPGAKTIELEDAAGDFFDSQNQPVQAEACLDIVRAEAYVSDTGSFFRLFLAGSVPGKVDDPDMALEWDFFIDADMNPTTGWTGQLVANDTGPDYLIRLIVMDGLYADIYNVKENRVNSVPCQVIGDIVDFALPASILKLDRFNMVVVTRKWMNRTLTALDKAPGEGHYNLPKGHIIVVSGLPAKRMESQHATIWYNEGNEERAEYCAEAFDAAYNEVNRLWGIVHQVHPVVYVYFRRVDMIEGLQLYSQMSKDDALVYGASGSPRPVKSVTHIPPDFDWRAVYQQQVAASMDLFC